MLIVVNLLITAICIAIPIAMVEKPFYALFLFLALNFVLGLKKRIRNGGQKKMFTVIMKKKAKWIYERVTFVSQIPAIFERCGVKVPEDLKDVVIFGDAADDSVVDCSKVGGDGTYTIIYEKGGKTFVASDGSKQIKELIRSKHLDKDPEIIIFPPQAEQYKINPESLMKK